MRRSLSSSRKLSINPDELKASYQESKATTVGEDESVGHDSSAKSLDNYSCVVDPEDLAIAKSASLWSRCWYSCGCNGKRNSRSLRTHLFFSFGFVCLVSLGVIAGIELATLYRASASLRGIGRRNLELRASDKFGSVSRYIADIIHQRMKQYDGLARILGELTKERFAGYPDAPGYLEDTNVPFPDMHDDTKNVYPIKADHLLPIDWQIPPNVNASNVEEHVHSHDRLRYYTNGVSSADAVIHFQGSCDPSANNDSGSPRYYPNCTDALNNNITSGGTVQPTQTFRLLHERASDYASPLLKALYEYHINVKALGIYFANDGAGASIKYPGQPFDGTTQYESVGCDWLLQPNPYNSSKTIGTVQQVARCHAAGEMVNTRDHNPLEKGWCRDQALNPDQMIAFGPFNGTHNQNLRLMNFGKAMYDQETQEFLGCTATEVSVDKFVPRLHEVTEHGRMAVIRYDDHGTVVSWCDAVRGEWNELSYSIRTAKDLYVGFDQERLEEVKRFFVTDREDYDATESFRFISASKNDHFVSAYPVPPPPEEFDPSYRPEFLVILAISEDEILDEVTELDDQVDGAVEEFQRHIIIAISISLGAVIFIIYVVALYLTAPLEWMNGVGDRIVSSFGAPKVEADSDTHLLVAYQPRWYRWSPRTEISSLVQQFQMMTQQFAGKGTAKLFKIRLTEVRNPFTLHRTFTELYDRTQKMDSVRYTHRSIRGLGLNPNGSLKMQGHRLRQRISGTPTVLEGGFQFLHRGSNVDKEDDSLLHTNPMMRGDRNGADDASASETASQAKKNPKVIQSALVFWIVTFIAFPLVIAMVASSTTTIVSLYKSLPDLILIVEDVNVALERSLLSTITQLRARYISEILSIPMRDLHVHTRMAGWLLMNSIKMSDTVTSMVTTAEGCKNYPKAEFCPLLHDSPAKTCDCSWGDPWGKTCKNYGPGESRRTQQLYFEGLQEDAKPNGDRNETSFPKVGNTPQNTSFWTNIDSTPGAGQSYNASGYESTFSRLRMLAAMSFIQIPLYNYVRDSSLERTWSTTIAFEAGGIVGGYKGCEYEEHSTFASYQLDETQWVMNPDLCPEGKFGCVYPYAAGKREALQGGEPLFVAAPSLSFDGSTLTQLAALPVMDTVNARYIAQASVLLDAKPLYLALNSRSTRMHSGGFPVMITILKDGQQSETVVAPKIELGETCSIYKALVPNDPCDNVFSFDPSCQYRNTVTNVFNAMLMGETHQTQIQRTSDAGAREVINVAYAPVVVRSLRPIDPSDFSRGVEQFNETVYSVALVQSEEGLLQSLSEMHLELERVMHHMVGFLGQLILVAVIIVVAVLSRASVKIVQPVIELLDLVKKINRRDRMEDLPKIATNSLVEVERVRATFEHLFLLVRFANTAFFAGDIEKAHQALRESLGIFTKLNNKKAIGIVNNNLGNTMLTMYRTMKKTGVSTLGGMTKKQAIEKGSTYFRRAINTGEEALTRINDETGWSTEYLIFMQQLSNRYFNRALFNLTVRDEHPTPEDAEAQGWMDMSTCRDMDREVVDNGDHVGFKGDADTHFEVVMSRIKGVLMLMRIGYPDEWGMEDLLMEARKELMSALQQQARHPMFRDIEPVGQMQRLEHAFIEYYRLTDQTDKAVEFAIRMLFEDEYLIQDAALSALKALTDGLCNMGGSLKGDDVSDIRSMLFQYRQMVAEQLNLSCVRGDFVRRQTFLQSHKGDFKMEFY